MAPHRPHRTTGRHPAAKDATTAEAGGAPAPNAGADHATPAAATRGSDRASAPIETATQQHEPAQIGSAGDAAATARALALCVAEILTGGRDLDTIARWVTGEVYRGLQRRVTLAIRARSVRRQPPSRAGIVVGAVRVDYPAVGVAEAAAVIKTKSRTRAVAIRLEMHGGRWRATCIGVL